MISGFSKNKTKAPLSFGLCFSLEIPLISFDALTFKSSRLMLQFMTFLSFTATGCVASRPERCTPASFVWGYLERAWLFLRARLTGWSLSLAFAPSTPLAAHVWSPQGRWNHWNRHNTQCIVCFVCVIVGYKLLKQKEKTFFIQNMMIYFLFKKRQKHVQCSTREQVCWRAWCKNTSPNTLKKRLVLQLIGTLTKSQGVTEQSVALSAPMIPVKVSQQD